MRVDLAIARSDPSGILAMWQHCDAKRDFVPAVGLSAQATGNGWMRRLRADYVTIRGTVTAVSHCGTITDLLLKSSFRPQHRSDTAGLRHHIATAPHPGMTGTALHWLCPPVDHVADAFRFLTHGKEGSVRRRIRRQRALCEVAACSRSHLPDPGLAKRRLLDMQVEQSGECTVHNVVHTKTRHSPSPRLKLLL